MTTAASRDSISDLIGLWQRARARTFHAAGCSCCNGGQAVVIDAVLIREGIEFALRARYRREGRLALLKSLDAACVEPFADWISTLATGPDATPILADIKFALLSMVDNPGGSR